MRLVKVNLKVKYRRWLRYTETLFVQNLTSPTKYTILCIFYKDIQLGYLWAENVTASVHWVTFVPNVLTRYVECNNIYDIKVVHMPANYKMIWTVANARFCTAYCKWTIKKLERLSYMISIFSSTFIQYCWCCYIFVVVVVRRITRFYCSVIMIQNLNKAENYNLTR